MIMVKIIIVIVVIMVIMMIIMMIMIGDNLSLCSHLLLPSFSLDRQSLLPGRLF